MRSVTIVLSLTMVLFDEWRLENQSECDGDPSFFEGLLNGTPLMSLRDSVISMNGIGYFHGTLQCDKIFNSDHAMPMINAAEAWAETAPVCENLRMHMDPDRATAIQKLAAVRAWTGEGLSYVITSVMRDKKRSEKTIRPILPYLKLFYAGLHSLPADYIFEGRLFRAEKGARPNFANVMRPGNYFAFFTPTSFTSNPMAAQNFKDPTNERTVFEVVDGVGYSLASISEYSEEHEVLVEGVALMQVLKSEVFDKDAPLTKLGEVPSGLNYVVAHTLPGVEVLAGSPAKAREKAAHASYTLAHAEPAPLAGALDLVFKPFSAAQWREMHPDSEEEDDQDDDAGGKERAALGSGTFGTTYRMQSRDGTDAYAVKIATAAEMRRAGITAKEFFAEAEILRALRHRNVVRYIAAEKRGKECWLIMELATAGTLADMIERGRQLDRTEMAVAEQLGAALSYVHLQGFLHRDIKPENILLSESGDAATPRVKLADFGLACITTSSRASVRATKSGRAGPGSAAYMSPEKAQGLGYGSKDDMWAAGCVLWELAAAARLDSPVWSDSDEMRMKRQAMLGRAKALSAVLGAAAERLLVVSKAQRFSAAQLLAFLQNPVPCPRCPPPPASTPSSPSLLWGVAESAWHSDADV